MAAQCKEVLKKKVEDEFFFRQMPADETAVKEKLTEIVINTDKQIAFEGKCDFKLSGCTFTMVLYYSGILFIANVGNAHCMGVAAKENKHGNSSRGNMSSIGGSEVFKMSSAGASAVSGMTSKTAAFATTNPTKAVAFLYRATQDLTNTIYGGRFSDFSLADARAIQMDILTSEHNVTNYEELLRLTQAGGVVCKDRKKTDMPYYVRPFKLYTGAEGKNWPALRVSRYSSSP